MATGVQEEENASACVYSFFAAFSPHAVSLIRVTFRARGDYGGVCGCAQLRRPGARSCFHDRQLRPTQLLLVASYSYCG